MRVQPRREGATPTRRGKQPRTPQQERRPEDATSPDQAFAARVYAAVRAIPRGHVASYGAIAALAGAPRSARGVGRALAALAADADDVPWWRVVNARGAISLSNALHGATLQRTLLEAEGVAFGGGGAIDMRAFGWPPGHDEERP